MTVAEIVLIESDWNLKNSTCVSLKSFLTELIESDWNLNLNGT